ncbi:N-succinylarginine dihydrolase [Frankliniella fusca]|uniref:N-succinylarginine dihydrolase n=1 Tax=Frankliniella fusca TaxID=407009 RepID=A0AAE1HH64_9NEOP|nr:N-succinylarginine dihydrolase [Frankliniella fusca]KAK3921511.1 N-succinylarginine dihydrolase [Frankliniella fusca]KAK3921641.1 N-succinylarginine dihydrolase [Frankliniella fusca]
MFTTTEEAGSQIELTSDEEKRREGIWKDLNKLPPDMLATNKEIRECEDVANGLLVYIQDIKGQALMHKLILDLTHCERRITWEKGITLRERMGFGPFTNFDNLLCKVSIFIDQFVEHFKYDDQFSAFEFKYGVLLPELIIEGIICLRNQKGLQCSRKEAEDWFDKTSKRVLPQCFVLTWPSRQNSQKQGEMIVRAQVIPKEEG